MWHFFGTVLPAVVVCRQSSVWEDAERSWAMLLSDLWQIHILLPKLCDLGTFCGSELLGPWSNACCRLFASSVTKQIFSKFEVLGKYLFHCFAMQSSRCLHTNMRHLICRSIGDLVRCVFFLKDLGLVLDVVKFGLFRIFSLKAQKF